MLNPVFSIAHMRRMVPIFDEVSRKVCAPGTVYRSSDLIPQVHSSKKALRIAFAIKTDRSKLTCSRG